MSKVYVGGKAWMRSEARLSELLEKCGGDPDSLLEDGTLNDGSPEDEEILCFLRGVIWGGKQSK